jgi:outer membrane protein X
VIGGAIRGGFELGRLRLAMEYNMIPRTVMFDAANIMQTVGTSNNSYLTVNLGFVLGGGKWRR